MSCEFEPDLTAYIDRELSPLRAKQVESHLADCSACRATHGLLERTLDSLAALPEFRPSLGFRRAVLAEVDRQPPGLRVRLRGFFRPVMLAPLAGALAAILAVGVFHRGPTLDLSDSERLELAANMEVVENLEVLGVASPEDAEVVQHLRELEAGR